MSTTWPELLDVAVLVISDDRASEAMLFDALHGRGCVIRTPGPRLGIDLEDPCDVGIVATRRLSSWTAGAITTVRSSRSACATVVLLNDGGPEDIAQSLRYGALDCMVEPISQADLLESLCNAVACTIRWRERIATAQQIPLAAAPDPERARVRVFEPVGASAPVTEATEERVEDLVGRLGHQNQLTRREREVLYWLIQGHRYDDIATVIGVTARTAKFHAANLLRKLDLASRYELPRLLAGDS